MKKKLTLTFGLLAVVAIPVATVVSCGTKNETTVSKKSENKPNIKPINKKTVQRKLDSSFKSTPYSQIVKSGFTNSFYSTGKEITWKPNHTITSAHDADTFKDESGTRYRLFGVDAAEISTYGRNHKNDPTTGLEHLWAQKATDYARNFLLNKQVTIIEKTRDHYGRSVASVFYKDINGEIKSIAMEMARLGLVRVGYISTSYGKYHVESKYYDYMDTIRTNAKQNKLGIYHYSITDQVKIFPKWQITA